MKIIRKSLLIYLLVILTLLTAALLVYLKIREKQAATENDCIGRGGRWDSELNECISVGESNPLDIEEFIWWSAYDTVSHGEYLLKGSKVETYADSPQTLVDLLNQRNQECKIKLIKQGSDTLYIQILNDEYLSEQMGSTGAWCYLGETVLTLTENKEINFVNIAMGWGSHASPGVYNRVDFEEMIIDLDALSNDEMMQEDSLLVD